MIRKMAPVFRALCCLTRLDQAGQSPLPITPIELRRHSSSSCNQTSKLASKTRQKQTYLSAPIQATVESFLCRVDQSLLDQQHSNYCNGQETKTASEGRRPTSHASPRSRWAQPQPYLEAAQMSARSQLSPRQVLHEAPSALNYWGKRRKVS